MTPMDAPLEIERKFLVATLPDLSRARRSVLRQGYVTLPADSVEVRLRQTDDSFVLCLKTGEGIVRTEREIAIDAAQFEALWPQTEGRRVRKTRWTGSLDGGLMFELDVFEGEPKVHPGLLDVPNVVLTPHIASATLRTRRAMADLAANNLQDYLLHGRARTPVNTPQPRSATA